MKKILSLFVLLVAIVIGAKAEPTTIFDAGDTFWSAKTKADLKNDVTNGNVTWYSTGTEKGEIATGNKTIGGIQWTARLKFGGSSTFKSGSDMNLVLSVTVPSSGTLKVYFLSGSKNKTRYVYVSSAPSSDNRDTKTAVFSASDDGNDGNIASGAVTAGTYYVWCAENIGVYGVTFEASAVGPVDPVFSLSTSDLQVGETAKILVGGEDIFADNFTAGTLWQSEPDCISLSADGVVTALKNTPANYYFHFFGTSKDDTKYNSVTSDNLNLTIATKYAISKTTPENGSITTSATSAPEGDEITLTATPDFRYALSAWNVYKTGEPATTITVTNNKFTMPAYAVTVDATFAADTKKQVLYVTGDGSVSNDDQLYSALSEDYTVTVAKYDASISPLTVTSFDLVVLHESIGGSNYNASLVAAAKSGNVPVLNTKAFFYTYNSDSKKNRWGWGTPNAGNKELGCTMNAAYSNIADHPIFEGITPGFISVVTGLSTSDKDKAMQPVGTIREGKEGYVLATSLNSDSGNGAAIHELTPAQRGVESAKYLLISLHNECFNKMTADGIKLFKNAAAYLMGAETWTPTLATTNITLNAKGFATYSNANDFTFSGAKAYKMALNETAKTITGTEVTGKIQAGAGILLKGEAGATVTITGATWATALEDNSLKGTTKADGSKAAKPEFCYTLSGDTFKKFKGAEFNDNKAYLESTQDLSGQSLEIIFDDQPTAISFVVEDDANVSAAPVKVIKNGQLFIGNYNVAGARIK